MNYPIQTMNGKRKSSWDLFYDEMEKMDDVFAIRDKTDAKELYEKSLIVISGTRETGYDRAWILTNNRLSVIDAVKLKLNRNHELKKLEIKFDIFPYSKQEETNLNIKAHADYCRFQVSTLIARCDSYGADLLIV